MNVIHASRKALNRVDDDQIARTITALSHAPHIFCVGNGGGAAHAAHFAADLRKIAHLRAHSFDNIPEMTARINDDGWETAWYDWRRSISHHPDDVTFLFSCGGGLDGVSLNLPGAAYGIVGRAGAFASRIVIPSTSTPVIEGCQSVIAHHIVEELSARS